MTRTSISAAAAAGRRPHPGLAAAAGSVAVVALIAGCSSARGASAKPAATQVSGTETISGQVTGAAAVNGMEITFPLVLTGPVNTTGTLMLSNGEGPVTITFKTRAGDLVAVATPVHSGVVAPVVVNAAACRLRYTARARFTVNGADSTGAFKDAHGSGTVTSPLVADAPRLADGKCDLSNADPLLPQGAVNTFRSVGPLTVP